MASERSLNRKRKIVIRNNRILSVFENIDVETDSDFKDDSLLDPNYSEKSDSSEKADEITFRFGRGSAGFTREARRGNASTLNDRAINHGMVWNNTNVNFLPRKIIPALEQPIILADINRSSRVLEDFFKVFPQNKNFIKIADCTNKQIDVLNKKSIQQ